MDEEVAAGSDSKQSDLRLSDGRVRVRVEFLSRNLILLNWEIDECFRPF